MRLRLTITLALLTLAGLSGLGCSSSSGVKVGKGVMMPEAISTTIASTTTTTSTTVKPTTTTSTTVTTITTPPVTSSPATVGTIASASTSFSGWCYGLPDNYMVRYIIDHESHCDVYAQNPITHDCGIGQLESGCYGFDGVAQAQAMIRYVMGRYGSWSAAYDHEVSMGWY